MIGPLPAMKNEINMQKIKYEALSDMKSNYKSLFKYLNDDE